MGDLAISIADLETAAARGWRAPDRERLGGWLLRAASGFTGRANSALATGEPGLPLAAALERVQAWYAARGLTALAAVPFPMAGPEGSAVDELAARLGWRLRQAPAIVMTADPAVIAALPGGGLAAAGAGPAGPGPAGDGPLVTITGEPDEAWIARYHYRGGVLPAAGRRLLMSAPWQAFASIRESGQTIAIGRVAGDATWAGLTAVETDPACRRRGLATAITAALARAAVRRGVRGLYLQVENENLAARALYRQAGFADHHRYHYRVAPAAGG
ncbi:MAG TPA: GNAT family N-acetyltransferase [Streptosporangiaceae bacterium]|jgi:ribosomal protein S18 acetylase RimI-like enzyme